MIDGSTDVCGANVHFSIQAAKWALSLIVGVKAPWWYSQPRSSWIAGKKSKDATMFSNQRRDRFLFPWMEVQQRTHKEGDG